MKLCETCTNIVTLKKGSGIVLVSKIRKQSSCFAFLMLSYQISLENHIRWPLRKACKNKIENFSFKTRKNSIKLSWGTSARYRKIRLYGQSWAGSCHFCNKKTRHLTAFSSVTLSSKARCHPAADTGKKHVPFFLCTCQFDVTCGGSTKRRFLFCRLFVRRAVIDEN